MILLEGVYTIAPWHSYNRIMSGVHAPADLSERVLAQAREQKDACGRNDVPTLLGNTISKGKRNVSVRFRRGNRNCCVCRCSVALPFSTNCEAYWRYSTVCVLVIALGFL